MLEAPKQFRRQDGQDRREAEDCSERGVLLPALKLSDIRRVIPTLERQRFLGHTPLLAQFTKCHPEEELRRLPRSRSAMPLHAQTNTATIQTIVTRDYSIDCPQLRDDSTGFARGLGASVKETRKPLCAVNT